MRKNFTLQLDVWVDTGSVGINDEGNIVFCNLTGDSYSTTEEFFEHQLERDLQVIQFSSLKILDRD